MSDDMAVTAPLPLRPAVDAVEQAAQAAQTPSTAGGMLRAIRRNRGLEIDQLAALLKVQPERLQAMEADRLDLLPDLVYARALFGSACRYLKVDAAPLLALLPSAGVRRMHGDDEGLNARFQSTGGGARWSSPHWLAKPMVWLVLVLVLAIALVLFWPSAASVSEPAAPTATQEVVPAPAEANPQALTAPSEPVAPDVAATPGIAQEAKQVAAAVAAPAAVAAAPAAPVTAVPVLTLEFKRDVWLSVTDAQGTVQVQKTAAAGDTLAVAGALPLSVVLGRADAVAVRVRGQNLNLEPWTKANVARFEVK